MVGRLGQGVWYCCGWSENLATNIVWGQRVTLKLSYWVVVAALDRRTGLARVSVEVLLMASDRGFGWKLLLRNIFYRHNLKYIIKNHWIFYNIKKTKWFEININLKNYFKFIIFNILYNYILIYFFIFLNKIG